MSGGTPTTIRFIPAIYDAFRAATWALGFDNVRKHKGEAPGNVSAWVQAAAQLAHDDPAAFIAFCRAAGLVGADHKEEVHE